MSSSKKRLRRYLLLVVGCVISLAAIWIATRGVDWREFYDALRGFKLIWLVPALLLFYYSMYLRAVRWALLLRPGSNLKGSETFGPLMVGFGFNSILPGRVGEFVRCLALNKVKSTGVARAFATVFAERMFDGLILLAMLALSLKVVPIDESASYVWHEHTLDASLIKSATNKLALICVLILAGIVAVLIPAVQRSILALIDRLKFLPQALRDKTGGLFREFSLGFESIKNPWTLAQVIFQSIVLWLLVGASNLTLAYGFDIEMTFLHALALVTLIGFAILIPAAPGYWGLYEAGVIFSLLILRIETNTSRSLAYGLIMHMVQWAPVVAIGLFYAARLHVRPPDEEATAEEIDRASV
jgi:hypothetical protein